MLVVSDTSPVSSLIQIGREELLRQLFGTVCVPVFVRDELARFHATIPEFLEVRDVVDRTRIETLLSNPDRGEAEAIVLAVELHADYLLMDERRGRSIATQAGISVIGLVGILLLAKQRGFVASVRECLLELQSRAGFYLSDALIQRAVESANE